jgi:hypothetical protein
MTHTRDLKILSFSVPARLHRDLKMLSVREDRPMVELATAAIARLVGEYKAESAQSSLLAKRRIGRGPESW